MQMNTVWRSPVVLVVPLLLCGCSQQCSVPAAGAEVDKTEAEVAVRGVANARIRAIADRQIDKVLETYEPSGWQISSNQPIAKTDEERRQFWQRVSDTPIDDLVTNVDSNTAMSSSGDIAVIYGTFRQGRTDKTGKPTTALYAYMSTWRKQADGSWKVVAAINTAPN